MQDLDDFTRHYIIAALWSSRGDENDDFEFLDEKYGIEDIAPETLEQMKADCAKFQASVPKMLELAYRQYKPHPDAPTPQCAAGHDFWFERNGLGVGFRDRGFKPEGLGWGLAGEAKKFKECDLYVGDDGKLYI